MKADNIVKINIQSRPENIAIARITVATFIAQQDITIDELEDVKVAVSEAVSNAIIHGYNNEEEEWVEIKILRYEKCCQIVIKDWGKGIENIKQVMEPAYSSDPERMGLGFVFMQTFMDKVEVDSEVGKGTTVTLTKELVAVRSVPS